MIEKFLANNMKYSTPFWKMFLLLTACERLKYVWNIYCVLTNHGRNLHTPQTTDKERFPIRPRTNLYILILLQHAHGPQYFLAEILKVN